MYRFNTYPVYRSMLNEIQTTKLKQNPNLQIIGQGVKVTREFGNLSVMVVFFILYILLSFMVNKDSRIFYRFRVVPSRACKCQIRHWSHVSVYLIQTTPSRPSVVFDFSIDSCMCCTPIPRVVDLLTNQRSFFAGTFRWCRFSILFLRILFEFLHR